MLTELLFRGRQIELDPAERAAIERAIGPARDVPARTTLVHDGDAVTSSTLLLDGLIGRYVDDRDGGRQLVGVHVTGDFVDLHGFPMRYLDHDMATLTDARIAQIPHDRLQGVLDAHPALWRKFWHSTLLDAAMHRQWLFRLGRLDAVGRVAHMMCEFNLRLAAIGASDGRSFALPLTQADIGEVCGLTNVHVNRVLRQLREADLLQVRGGRVTLLDPGELARRGQFDADYLYLDQTNPGLAALSG